MKGTIGSRAARVAALGALALGVALFALSRSATVASRKAFWVDEGYEIVRTCGEPRGHMLVHGARECSPAPLYWIAQSFVVRNVEPLGPSLRVKYRAVSMAAAALTLLVLCLGVGRRLGLAAAGMACSVLLADRLFFHYAAESRAYMTWVFVTALLAAAAVGCALADARRSTRATALLVGAALLSGMTTLPGGFQALAALAAAALARKLSGGARLSRTDGTLLVAGGVAVALLDWHYWVGTVCWQVDLKHWNVLASHQPWTLVRRALVPIWPEASSGWSWLGRGLLLTGALVPVAYWKERTGLAPEQRAAFATALVAVGQVLVAFPVAGGLFAGHYLFLPRMFLFLLVPQAVLTALGFWLAARGARALVPARLAPAVRAAAASTAALALAAGLLWADAIADGWQSAALPAANVSCDDLRREELRLLRAPGEHYELTPNFLARLGTVLDGCPAGPFGPPAHVLALASPEADGEWLRVSETAPAGTEPMRVCGKPVVVSRGGVTAPDR